MKILLIGCGKMGGAMLRRWASDGSYHFTVADPTATDLPDGVSHVLKATDLQAGTFDVVLIAIKPQMIADILPEYAKRKPLEVWVKDEALGGRQRTPTPKWAWR